MDKLRGVIVAGFDEGAFFIRKYASRIKKALGFTPFAGTLNLKANAIEAKAFLKRLKPTVVNGFDNDGKSFGGIALYPVKINGLGCAIIKPERTRHDDSIVEVIAEFNLKKKLGLKNGVVVELES